MLFPVLLAILTGMAGCTKIGTLSDWIGSENLANTDRQNEIIAAAKLFSLRPLVPFKWGFPEPGSITVAGGFGMLAALFESMTESVGDYYSCARISEASVPASKMISRGLGA